LISYNDLYKFAKKKVAQTLSDRKYKKNVAPYHTGQQKMIKKMAAGIQPPFYSCLFRHIIQP